jgi:DNA-binding MarR family transcriptional regulator
MGSLAAATTSAPSVFVPAVQPHLLLLAAAGAALLLGGALYHRITRNAALEQESRRRVYGAIVAKPGVRVGTLACRLGMDYNSAKRHTHVLERLGFVRGVGAGQKHWFASGAMPHPEAQLRADALTSPAARDVYRLLLERGPTDLPALGEALGLAPSTVSTVAAKLTRAGLVARRRDRRRVVLEVARALAAPLAPSPAVEVVEALHPAAAEAATVPLPSA